jgi:hypothetical protein
MNKSTARARKEGFCSSKDAMLNGNKIYKGDICDTAWNAKGSKKKSKKIYKNLGNQ